jgi:hypothetical protein
MATNTDKVQQLYVAYFNRPADVAGLNFWVGALAKGVTVDTIAASFATQAEYKALFAGKGAESIINTVYLNMFGRNAEKAALDFYGPLVQNGTISIDKVVTDIVKGAQGTDATAYNNKVTAAKAFTAALDTAGNEADRIAYATGTDAVLSIAKTWLATVTTDASLTTALAAVEATVDSMGGLGNVGQTFTLTQGLDTLLGTASDDTFNAFAFNGTTGSNVTTLNSVDTVDGGTGVDSLFIEVKDANGTDTTNLNGTIVGTFKNIEKITIDNTAADLGAALNTVDASKFVGATSITQVTNAAAVTGLAATTTAGFKGVTATVAGDLGVNAAATAASVSVNLDGVKGAAATGGGETENQAYIEVSGAVMNSATVTGTLAQTTTTAGAAAATLSLEATVGTDQETFSLNTGVTTVLTVNDTGSTDKVATVDATASTGKLTFVGDADVLTIKGGAGNDTLTLASLTSAASGSTAAVNGAVDGGAGADKITVTTTGTGATTVTGGAGNDVVSITGRGTGVLTVNLGDGNDTFTSSVAVGATDVIDAGAGTDTLLLSLVGSANVGAFKNFDSFDVKGMTANLDLDILNAANTVSEIVGSGPLGAAVTLQNVAAGVSFRATADMGVLAANVLTLTQKTAGALTVALDADEGTADAADDTASMSIKAEAATSITAKFTTDYKAAAGDVAGETAATDNVSTIALATQAATAITVESGGAFAKNVLNVTEGAGTDKLATITVTGDKALTVTATGASTLATIDASAATGGLTASFASLKANAATIKLGSGVDAITATAAVSNATAGADAVVGFEKAAAVSVSTAAADATAKAAAIADADVLVIASAAVADASTSALAATLSKGVLTFTGAGPATLAAALVIADDFAETLGESVAFQYLGDTYVFSQGATHAVGTSDVGATDIVVKLTGVTGVTNFVESTTLDNFFIV